MARRAAKNVPGSERYRDERRKGGGPRMHGRKWHDHEEPHDLERVSENEGNEAVIEAESSGERKGMGRSRKGSGSQGRERRKRTVPPGKGLSKRAAGKRGKTAKAAKQTAKKPSMSGTRKKAGPRGSRRV